MDVTAKWHGKRYYSLDAYLKNTYGQKFKKISIDANVIKLGFENN